MSLPDEEDLNDMNRRTQEFREGLKELEKRCGLSIAPYGDWSGHLSTFASMMILVDKKTGDYQFLGSNEDE